MINNQNAAAILLTRRRPQFADEATDFVYRASYTRGGTAEDYPEWNYTAETGQAVSCNINGAYSYTSIEDQLLMPTTHLNRRCVNFVNTLCTRSSVFDGNTHAKTDPFTACVFCARAGRWIRQSLLNMSSWGYNLTRDGFCLRLLESGQVQTWFGRNAVATSLQVYDVTAWHHYAIVYTGNLLRTYIDGSMVTEVSGIAPSRYAPTMIYLNEFEGTWETDSTSSYYADARVYSRALSSSEIYKLSKGG